ncbi:MAG TPA: magnesium transporter CorA family protein [Candidatus Acidoferrales bacterium]|nr:magnesium transporter CorA family protein [Candidatus Acidoferrales bacterium]
MNVPTVTHNGLSFINLNKPTSEQIAFLNKNFGFSMLHLEDYLYKTQIPKIEVDEDYSLIVMDVPYIQQAKIKPSATNRNAIPNVLSSRMAFPSFPKSSKRKRINIGEVDFFIGKDYLVVLHDDRTPQIDELFSMCKITSKHRDDLMGKGPAYLFYRIADILVDISFGYVEDITSTIDYIDKLLEDKSGAALIEDISVTRRNIVVFETMIKPLLPIFGDLEKGRYPKLNGEMTDYWSNLLDHLQKIWERLEDNKELIAGIATSNESILSNRSNELVKFLTVVTSISFPFVIVNNLYSMNVKGLPYANDPWIVPLLFSVILVSGISIIAYFKYRDWL